MESLLQELYGNFYHRIYPIKMFTLKKNFILLRRIFKNPTWNDFEYFDEQWKKRIKLMADFIKPGETVLDLGCGKMWLKEFINHDNKYIGVDYKFRDENTIICDFNRNEFPTIFVDVAFVSGTLEYIKDIEGFVRKISNCSNSCIISYCSIEYFPNIFKRKKLGWINHLSEKDIEHILNLNNMYLAMKILTSENNSIFYFLRNRKAD